jgi:hypothetical protein
MAQVEVLHVVGQLLHAPSPSTNLYLPVLHVLGQLLHAPSPSTNLYLPCSHIVQAPPPAPVKPAPHLQSSTDLLPAGDTEFVGQLLHAPKPASGLYLPGP